MDKNTEIIKSKVKSSVVQLIIAICGAFVAVFGLWMFNQHLLMSFSLPIRMILMIITQWLLFLVPGILMIVNKESLGDIGFRKEKNSVANRHRSATCFCHVVGFNCLPNYAWFERNGRKHNLYADMEICLSIYLRNIWGCPCRRINLSRLHI
jgi:hypothetical protein